MKALALVLSLAYPFLVLAGLKWLDTRTLGLVVLLCIAARLLLARAGTAFLRPAFAVPALVLLGVWIALTAILEDPRGLLIMPALVNAALLVAFAQSLFRPPSVVETLARAKGAVLSPAVVSYCRAVTCVWCVFFLLNGSVSAWLAWSATQEQWALYTGCISYVLVGALFAAEFVYRHYRFRHYVGSAADPLLKRFFPPRGAS